MNKQELEIWTYEYAQKNILFLPLIAPPFEIRQNHIYSALSYLTYYNLKSSKYNLILFPEMNGMAHYCLWAQQTGVSFQNTKLVIMYHGPKEWHHLYNASVPVTLSELVVYHTEKASCQMANHVYYATKHSRKIAESLDYKPQNSEVQSEVVLYPFRQPKKVLKTKKNKKKITEICFFGRIETRKGIKTFLKSLSLMRDFIGKNNIKITFIGSLGHIDPYDTNTYLSQWSRDNSLPIQIMNDMGQSQALDYLREHNCLALLPSLEETMGYTLIECITHDIPFICSDIDPFREILLQFNMDSAGHMFPTNNPVELMKLMSLQIKTNAPSSCYNFNSAALEKKWIQSLEKVQKKKNTKAVNYYKINTHAEKRLSFCIVHREREVYLDQLLKSLVPLDNLIGEILIFDNGSVSDQAQKYLKNIEKIKKIKLIRSKTNEGPSAARNKLAAASQFENILFIDDDNVLDASAFKKMYLSLPKEWDTVVAPLKTFMDADFNAEILAGTLEQAISSLDQHVIAHQPPIGNSISLNIMENANGDANFLVKRSHFLKINGFDPKLNFGEDQAFLIKSQLQGGIYKLCPEPFVFYRRHSSNLSSRLGPSNDNYTQLLKSISNSIQIPELTPFLMMTLAWRHEKSRFDNTHDLYRWSLAERTRGHSFNKREFCNLLQNESHTNHQSVVLVMNKIKNKATLKIKSPTKKKNLSLILYIYTQKSGLVYINRQALKLQAGNNKIEVKIDTSIQGHLFFESKTLKHLYIKNYTLTPLARSARSLDYE